MARRAAPPTGRIFALNHPSRVPFLCTRRGGGRARFQMVPRVLTPKMCARKMGGGGGGDCCCVFSCLRAPFGSILSAVGRSTRPSSRSNRRRMSKDVPTSQYRVLWTGTATAGWCYSAVVVAPQQTQAFRFWDSLWTSSAVASRARDMP